MNPVVIPLSDSRLCDCWVFYSNNNAYAVEPLNEEALSRLVFEYGAGAMEQIPVNQSLNPVYNLINLDNSKAIKVTDKLLHTFLDKLNNVICIQPVNYK